MTEPLAQARALLEHFKSDVCRDAVSTEDGLNVPLFGEYWITVNISYDDNDDACADKCVVVLVDVPQPSMLLQPDHLSRLGGMLIQISNLVRQIRALAGGNAHDSGSSRAAV